MYSYYVETNKLIYKAYSIFEKGYVCDLKGEYPKAIMYYDSSLVLFTRLEHKMGVIDSYNNIAICLQNMGNYKEALKNYLMALKLSENVSDEFNKTRIIINIANIYFYQKELDKALNNFMKAKELAKKIKYNAGLAMAINNIGAVYEDKKEFQLAMNCFVESKKLREEMGDKSGLAQSLNNIGSVYILLNKPELAISYFKQSAEIYEEYGELGGLASSKIKLAEGLIKLGQFKDARINLESGLKTANEIKLADKKVQALKLMSELYEGEGNYKQALFFHKLFMNGNDSLLNADKINENVRLEMNYEFNSKQQKLKAEQDKKEAIAVKENERQRTIIYFISSFLLLVLALVIVAFRSVYLIKNKNKIISQQKNIVEEKQKEIISSIRYAKRIQQALLPSEKYFEKNLKN
jgi:tetratricopeptide (TPR) repeat protein